jgi:hypothetical protein
MSDNKIFPDKIIKTRKTSYGYRSTEYSYETIATHNGFLGMLIFIALSFVSPFISGIFLIMFCIDASFEAPINYNYFGIIYSGYLIYDIKKEWLLSAVMGMMYDKSHFQNIIYLNITFILAHILLLIYGDDLCDGSNGNGFSLFIWLSVFVLIVFFITKFIFKIFLN